MKMLVVKYLPSLPNSNTARLLEHFQHHVPIGTTVAELDLLEKEMPIFKKDSMAAYVKRNMMGQEINEEEKRVMKPFDELVVQVKSVDAVVLAFPMHNFSVPGIIKTYIDAIMFDRETWYHGDAPGQYQPLMKGKKALILSASGGLYLSQPTSLDHLTPLMKLDLEFMGFETTTVLAEGMVRELEVREASFARCFQEIDAVCHQWFQK